LAVTRAAQRIAHNARMTALTVATYNIHKGTLGVGPAKQLRIHALREAIKELDADLLFLQEVQHEHEAHAEQFSQWPTLPQHEFLAAPFGYHSAYETNARTRHGEHGNALLSRFEIGEVWHSDISDHRFEQRGLLHVHVLWHGKVLHCIVVHLGLLAGGRGRQVAMLARYIEKNVPMKSPLIVAGDFNDWHGRIKPQQLGGGLHDVTEDEGPSHLLGHFLPRRVTRNQRVGTFPAQVPLLPLDRIYVRGFRSIRIHVPKALRGTVWHRVSDHAPLVARLEMSV
jgi:endonuclease/exonuclease/phosphatase family metal-dependent hydrolase